MTEKRFLKKLKKMVSCQHKKVAVIERYGKKEKKEWVKCLNPDCLLDGAHHYETPTTKEYTAWWPYMYTEPKNVKKIIKKPNVRHNEVKKEEN